MKFRTFILFGLALTAAFMLSGCETIHSRLLLKKAAVEVLPSPDVHGADQEMASHTGKVRISGGVRYGGSDRVRAGELENVQTPESFSFCNQCGAVKPKPEYKISELFYDVTTYPWYGTFQFIHKKELMTWGVGFGFDNALYVSGSAGFNTKHFEVGGTLTLGVMSVLQEREGLSLGCSKGYVCGLDGCEVSDKLHYGESYEKDEESSFSGIVSPGIYASAYWKQFSLTYSGSVYWPDNIFDEDPSGDFTSNIVKTKGDYLPAAVFTNHFSVGYIFDNGVGIRLGATSVFGEFEGWHWSGFGGLEINL